MRVRILCQTTLTNSVFYGGCKAPQQRYWWLRDLTRQCFIALRDKYMQGNKPFEVELDIEPGVYELGCGPRGPRGIRYKFEVTTDEEADIVGMLWLLPGPEMVEITNYWSNNGCK